MAAIDDLQAELSRLHWQATLLREQADADFRRAKWRFVHTLRRVYASHPHIARIAWWYWRHWLKRGWDARPV